MMGLVWVVGQQLVVACFQPGVAIPSRHADFTDAVRNSTLVGDGDPKGDGVGSATASPARN
jgi:hypothetical protein